jgi:hypothetical protein
MHSRYEGKEFTADRDTGKKMEGRILDVLADIMFHVNSFTNQRINITILDFLQSSL